LFKRNKEVLLVNPEKRFLLVNPEKRFYLSIQTASNLRKSLTLAKTPNMAAAFHGPRFENSARRQ
jgi:hypothetical protein